MIKFYYYLASLAMILINITAQAQKIEGAGIPPSKVQAYSNESAQYSVSGLEGRLTWDVTYGHTGSPFGFSKTEITWGTTSEGKIVVRNDKNEYVQVTVQVAPPAPKFDSMQEELRFLYFSNISDCSYYQWTIPNGLKLDNNTGTIRIKKKNSSIYENLVYVSIDSPEQLYYEGEIKVQAISDKNSLLSRATTYKYIKLDLNYLNILEKPTNINYKEQFTIVVEKIEGAIYKWKVKDGTTIINGQNTNRIVINPNNSEWSTFASLEFTYHGVTKNRDFSIPIKMGVYIDGPTDVSNNELVSYTIKSPNTNIGNNVKGWILDGRQTLNENTYYLNTDTISVGTHSLRVISLIPPFEVYKTIVKHPDSQAYTITLSSNNLIISKNKLTNSSLSLKSITDIYIFDQRGINVLTRTTPFETKDFSINLNGIKEGIYFVIVSNGSNKTQKKIIIK